MGCPPVLQPITPKKQHMRPFGGKSDDKALQLVQRGTDKRIPVELVKQPLGEVLDPAELEELSVKVKSDQGAGSAPVPHTIEDNKLVVEVTAEVTRQLGLGVYTLTATGRIPDEAYADGYHDYEIVVPLCRVTKYGSNETPVKVTANVLEGLKGKDGLNNYQIAVKHGYQGTEEDFAKALIPKSNYEREKELNGFEGTEEEYLASLHGAPGEGIYEMAKRNGFVGSEDEYLKSQKGKSAYESYLNTTTDNPKLTEAEWAKVNDYHYAIIHRYIYGKDAPMSQNKLMGDELVALHQYIKEVADALASVGVKVSETDGIASFPQKIRDYIPPTLLIFRTQQFSGYKQEWFPILRVDPNYTQADLSYLFNGNVSLTKMPEVEGIERAISLTAMYNGCSSMAGEAKLPDLPRCTMANNVFVGCSQLTKVTIGDMPLVEDVGSLISGCSNVTELTIGALPKLKKSFSMCINCSSLRLVRFSSGMLAPLGDMSYMFSGCSLLQRIDGVLEISSVSNVTNIFAGCYELSDVKVKLSASKLDLSSCYKLSAESLRYLIDNAMATRGGVITLSSQLSTRDELRETLEYVGAKAVDKGFSVVYR